MSWININMKFIKKAVFTVEAAFIVPLTVTVTVLLLGLCYYTHQNNWCKGVSAEAVLYSMQRTTVDNKAAAITERMEKRLKEIPLNTGDIKTAVSADTRISVHYESTVLPDVFNERFGFSGGATITDPKPMTIKRVSFIAQKAF